MQKEKPEKKKREKKNRIPQIIFTALAGLLVLGVSITVYSKYYKTGYNKGMAIASGFYFSSNFMAVTEDLKGKTMEEIARDHLDSVIISANPTSWKGTDAYTFGVEVRNYDNHLLYNDRDLNVEYQIEFMLLEEPKGATYQVGFGTETKRLTKKGNVVSFKGKLPGGGLKADVYSLSVGMTNAGIYEPADVLMVAYPIGPDYLVDTKCMAGIVRAIFEEREFKIEEGSGFTVIYTEEYEKDWKAAVEPEAGFVYQLITTGSYTGSETTSTTKKIKIKWKKDIFKISMNDEYYQEALKHDAAFPTEPKQFYEDGEWQVMEVEVMPYASIKFVFFRNDGFEPGLSGITQKEDFEALITAEVVTQ